MKTIELNIYQFDELSEDAKQKAIDDVRNSQYWPYDEWYDCIIDDIKTALEMIGFNDVKIGFSGFWSQGGGAHFTGSYQYKSGALNAVIKEFPMWKGLHTLAKELQKLEKKDFYQIRFSINHTGRYSHEMATSFDFQDMRENYGNTRNNFDENSYKDVCRSFMQDIYRMLEREYEFLTSDEYITEHLQINECQFLENGESY